MAIVPSAPAAALRAANERQRRGLLAEASAARLLQQAGFCILLRNYRCRGGELDIVARRGNLLVIAEVRLRSSGAFGGAAHSITAAKRRRWLFAARHLLAHHPALARLDVRFDALLTCGAAAQIEWLEAVM